MGAPRVADLIGFHSEVGRDDALDDACRVAEIPLVEIRHMGGTTTTHWWFADAVRFFPVTSGPPARQLRACVGSPQTAEAGIGLRWPRGDRSRMAVRGLLAVGEQYVMVQLGVRSTMTFFLLEALLDHLRVLTAADELIDRGRHPEPVLYPEVALPLRAGAEIMVGRGEQTAITPFVPAHPAQIDREYVRALWRPAEVHEAALAAWPGIVQWAHWYAADPHDRDGGVSDETSS